MFQTTKQSSINLHCCWLNHHVPLVFLWFSNQFTVKNMDEAHLRICDHRVGPPWIDRSEWDGIMGMGMGKNQLIIWDIYIYNGIIWDNLGNIGFIWNILENLWKPSGLSYCVPQSHDFCLVYRYIYTKVYTIFRQTHVPVYLYMKWWSNLTFSILFSGRILNLHEISMFDG